MEKITKYLKERFQGKYDFLKLKNVQISKASNEAVLSLFFPRDRELSDEEREEIKNFLYEKLGINNLKIKILKSYLDVGVIRNDIYNYIKNNHKLVSSSVSFDDVEVQISDLSVYAKITLATRAKEYFEENRLVLALIDYLNKHYIADFSIDIVEDKTRLNDIDLNVEVNFELPKVTLRYDVEPLKKVIGKEVTPKPEYIKNVKGKKTSVIIGGIIENFKERSFTVKKGKHLGEQKAFFTFDINDGEKIEFVVFSTKASYDNLSKLEDGLYVYGLGDVEYNKYGNLSYKVKDLYLARPINLGEWEKQSSLDVNEIKSVVNVEKMPSLIQDSLFGKVKTYDDNITNKTIVVYDLETTGLDTNSCEIIEIGAVKIVNGVVCEKFETLVKPKNPIPKDATQINHITDQMVSNAPDVSLVLVDFYKFTEGAVLAGHNIIGFDNKVLFRIADSIGLHFNNEILDTLILSRRKVFLPHYNLSALSKFYKVPLEEAHRAWNDAYANALVLLEMCRNDAKAIRKPLKR